MNSFLKTHLNPNNCFLCGVELDENTRSDEHGIPEWLQRHHKLWNQRLTLLNGSKIPYRQLLIPCCIKCNNEPLARMEAKAAGLLRGPYRQPTSQEEFLLFQWCSKILYGLLHREMMLLADRRKEDGETIVSPQFLEQLTTFHHFMTSIRRPFQFDGFVPYSIFVVETLRFDDEHRNFHYVDFIPLGPKESLSLALCLAVRIDHFGVVCVFQDNGQQKQHIDREFSRFSGIPLHPIQFLELTCKSAYKHSLLRISPTYDSIARDDDTSEVLVVQANSPVGEVWQDWDHTAYANIFRSLAASSGYSVPPEFVEDGQLTYLSESDGSPARLTDADESHE